MQLTPKFQREITVVSDVAWSFLQSGEKRRKLPTFIHWILLETVTNLVRYKLRMLKIVYVGITIRIRVVLKSSCQINYE